MRWWREKEKAHPKAGDVMSAEEIARLPAVQGPIGCSDSRAPERWRVEADFAHKQQMQRDYIAGRVALKSLDAGVIKFVVVAFVFVVICGLVSLWLLRPSVGASVNLAAEFLKIPVYGQLNIGGALILVGFVGVVGRRPAMLRKFLALLWRRRHDDDTPD